MQGADVHAAFGSSTVPQVLMQPPPSATGTQFQQMQQMQQMQMYQQQLAMQLQQQQQQSEQFYMAMKGPEAAAYQSQQYGALLSQQQQYAYQQQQQQFQQLQLQQQQQLHQPAPASQGSSFVERVGGLVRSMSSSGKKQQRK
ncbi:hypothetical protein HK405_010096 [Cladochytrium tenue]|nr:hypothetical protein HK405_010096 [Cladochytrium tenue]